MTIVAVMMTTMMTTIVMVVVVVVVWKEQLESRHKQVPAESHE